MNIKTSYPEFKFYLLFSVLLTLMTLSSVKAQPGFSGKEDLLSTPKKYTAFFNAESPKIDGKLEFLYIYILYFQIDDRRFLKNKTNKIE